MRSPASAGSEGLACLLSGSRQLTQSRLLQYAGGTMYFRGRYFAGVTCRECKVLFDNADDSMLAFARTNPPQVT